MTPDTETTDTLPNLFRLGLKAFIVDLDGVVTHTAAVHATAWKDLFDAFLKQKAEAEGTEFVPFDLKTDYETFVDGKPRYDGVRSFLASRGIVLPDGTPDDPADAPTVCGLGNQKNHRFNEVIERDGVTVFHTTVALIEAMRARGVKTAVVSSSKNCRPILERAGLMYLFEVMVDGIYSEQNHLPGKPAPDTYVRAADLLGVPVGEAAIVEDAIVGVASGRAGDFGYVIGVDRGVGHQALLEGGADIVVNDLGEFGLD
ncbi:MAG: HAD-IA family hydrolase [Rhodospirillaceae bacterium]|nr:HAD-IA family hydrolase [Rhodospirillaceae bacterium]